MTSIVTAIFKSESYLPTFLKLLLKFSEDLEKRNFDFEVVFVSTKPSEKEKELLKQVENKKWCRVICTEERGLYRAWNIGVGEAKGGMVGFWNVDDVRFPDALIEAQQLFNKGADLVYFPFKIKRYVNIFGFSFPVFIKTVDGDVLNFSKEQFASSMTCGPFFMFKKSLYEQVGPFDEQFKIVGDFDWCVRAVKVSQKFSRAKNLGGVFRVDGTGLSAGGKDRHVAENNVVYIRHGLPEKVIPGLEEITKIYDTQNITVGQNKILYTNPWKKV